jgi:serine/threonine-protein kinase
MLTGEVPFPHGSLTDKLQAHAKTPAPDPRDINDTIPEEVVLVLQRMLEKSPDRRHRTPGELVSALETIVLNRTEITTDDIAALADADAETISHTSRITPPQRERKDDTPTRDPATQKHSPRPAAPPPSSRSRRNALQPEHHEEDRQGIDLNKLKSIGLFLLAATILGVLGYVFATLGQSIDVSTRPGGTSPTPPTNTTPPGSSRPSTTASADTSLDPTHTSKT